METPKQPRILFSSALKKINQYSNDSKKLEVIQKSLNAARARLEDLKKYIQDVDSEETTSSAKEKQAFSNTREVLVAEREELTLEIEYLIEEEQRLIALIGYEGNEIDNLPHGNV